MSYFVGIYVRFHTIEKAVKRYERIEDIFSHASLSKTIIIMQKFFFLNNFIEMLFYVQKIGKKQYLWEKISAQIKQNLFVRMLGKTFISVSLCPNV